MDSLATTSDFASRSLPGWGFFKIAFQIAISFQILGIPLRDPSLTSATMSFKRVRKRAVEVPKEVW
ncbi:hypothetical protein QBC46DRAFT_345961 [Diplogelasinospora grovesii]|uniref:Uncharacterized protein n=1 Tax=Diplogelasinospora grovesii TaxID=303347 RepID=A0AAN6S0K7_9PEZI|nr:hypothetical protein QBC46DRAFT_345961 [Diplogelasinospora grovesii]